MGKDEETDESDKKVGDGKEMEKVKIVKVKSLAPYRKDLSRVGRNELIANSEGKSDRGYLFLCPFKGKDCDNKARNHLGDGVFFLPHKSNEKYRAKHGLSIREGWEHYEEYDDFTLVPSVGMTGACMACRKGERKACHISIVNSELVVWES